MAGRTGCGICGVEQLAQVKQHCNNFKQSNRLQTLNPTIFNYCLIQLEAAQQPSQQTGADHTAAFYPYRGIISDSRRCRQTRCP